MPATRAAGQQGEMQMSNQPYIRIPGVENGHRLESRILEERIQKAVEGGYRYLEIEAYGQHGLGGRLWKAGDDPIYVKITGSVGQRVGSMGFPNTRIEVFGPGSDDVGWLNGGAEITIHGNAANGIGNAMAQGKIYVAGNTGARGMTMTKRNPRFEPPELWVLGSVGDYFAEFMAGGIAVVCGYEPQNPENVLGYRPCVGMVGGRIYFRGPHKGYSRADARLMPLSDEDWSWLSGNLKTYLRAINRLELLDQLEDREQWQSLIARGPQEKYAKPARYMAAFRREIWDEELGRGGLIGDLRIWTAVRFPSSPRDTCAGTCPSGKTGSTPPPVRRAVPRGCPCTSGGASSGPAESTRPSISPCPIRLSRPRSAGTCARTCACRAARAGRSTWLPSTSANWARRA